MNKVATRFFNGSWTNILKKKTITLDKKNSKEIPVSSSNSSLNISLTIQILSYGSLKKFTKINVKILMMVLKVTTKRNIFQNSLVLQKILLKIS